jgi:NDP-sugar pyrophosphorylase family protein
VDSVVYCIGYLGEQVQEFVGNGTRWGLEVAYSDEGQALRGTAGAVRQAADLGLLHDRFLVLYGDSWLQIDPAEVYRASQHSGLPALMTVFENSGRWDESNVVYADGVVVRYEKGLDPRPADMRWIDYGLSVHTRELIERAVPASGIHDLAPLCTSLAEAGQLAGYLATERFYEIGSPDGLAEASELLAGRATKP